jgi:hypothetical protein
MQEAIAIVKTEMEKENNPYVKVVGQFLLQHLDKNPSDAEKIIIAEKTILKSLDEMRKAAEKKKVGNCAVLNDEEGFTIVLKYYGIDRKPVAFESPVVVPVHLNSKNFDVKLDDFL